MTHAVVTWITNFISSLGYWGIYFGMFIESASIPLPSEVIMGFAGYLVYLGRFSLFKAALVGALGNISGSTVMYVLGSRFGRGAVLNLGKYVHLTEAKFNRAEQMFKKWGALAVFIGQLLPGVRTYISLPAGVLRIKFIPFLAYTFFGALIWCYILAWGAFKLGENWHLISNYVHEFAIAVAAIAIAGVLYWFFVRPKLKKS